MLLKNLSLSILSRPLTRSTRIFVYAIRVLHVHGQLDNETQSDFRHQEFFQN